MCRVQSSGIWCCLFSSGVAFVGRRQFSAPWVSPLVSQGLHPPSLIWEDESVSNLMGRVHHEALHLPLWVAAGLDSAFRQNASLSYPTVERQGTWWSSGWFLEAGSAGASDSAFARSSVKGQDLHGHLSELKTSLAWKPQSSGGSLYLLSVIAQNMFFVDMEFQIKQIKRIMI